MFGKEEEFICLEFFLYRLAGANKEKFLFLHFLKDCDVGMLYNTNKHVVDIIRALN